MMIALVRREETRIGFLYRQELEVNVSVSTE